MTYCKKEDLFEACKKSAVESWSKDDGRDDENIINSRIESAIARASDEMNLYLSAKYTLPIVNIPLSLRDICVKLSLYQLLSRKGLNGESADNTIKVNRDTALKQLEMIASGKLNIGELVDREDSSISIPEKSSQVYYQFPKSPFGRS